MKNYAWPYLKETKERGEKLLKILKGTVDIPSVESVFDLNCGYAPLYEALLAERGDKLRYYGSDINVELIEELKKKYPKAQWFDMPDTEMSMAAMKTFDLFLLLGITGGTKDYESKTEDASAIAIIKKTNPRFVVLERSDRAPHDRIDTIFQAIKEHYTQAKYAQYEFGDHINGKRRVYIYVHR